MSKEKIEYVKQWLQKANDDLRAFDYLMRDEFPITSIAGFHLQQAAEKFLKAFLEANNIFFARTHDIEYLLHLCSELNPAFANVETGNLTDYAVDIRYPGDQLIPSVDELIRAKEWVHTMKRLVEEAILPFLFEN